MVANIDDWLFRLADVKPCEPEEVKCKQCKNITCPYWADEHGVSND